MENPFYKDKFERWLEKFSPEHLEYYKRGYGKGDIDICEIYFSDNHNFYHLYYNNRLLGTLVD